MAGSQKKLLTVACVALLAVVVGLAAAFGWQFTGELERQFNDRAELNIRNFSDRVLEKIQEFDDLADANLDAFQQSIEKLVNDRARGEIIYAQVVQNGVLIAEQRTYVLGQTQLDVMPLEENQSIVLKKSTMPSGTAYLDVRRTLANSPDPIDPDSYVRLGFSLATLQRDILNRQLQTVLWGLGGAVFGIGLLVFIFWRMSQTASTTPVETPVSVQPAVVTADNGAGAAVGNAAVENVPSLIQCGDLSIDDASKSVKLKEKEIPMSPREYELLKLLTAHPGKIFSNDEIVKLVWSDDQYAIPQDVKKYIYLLRKKLEENPKRPKRLLTVRGFGYKLVDATSS